MAAISLLVADDHLLLRDTLGAMLEAGGGFEVTAAATLQETLFEIAQRGSFDLVLLDVVMPGMNGLSGISQVVAANAPGRVVVMSGNVGRGFVEQVIGVGARGFVPKTLGPHPLAEVLQQIAAGAVWLPAEFRGGAALTARPLAGLTPQETRVLRYLCEGLSNRAIADAMELTEITIKTHMRAISLKLGAKNRTHAALIGSARLSEHDTVG